MWEKEKMFKLNKVNFDLHEFVDFSALKLKQCEINTNFHDFKSFYNDFFEKVILISFCVYQK